MKKSFKIAALLIALYACNTPATAQNEAKQSIKMANNDDVRCRKEVSQYNETLQFVRQTAGDQVSAKVMQNYVPIDQLSQVVANSGYCAGAQLLRDKRANR